MHSSARQISSLSLLLPLLICAAFATSARAQEWSDPPKIATAIASAFNEGFVAPFDDAWIKTVREHHIASIEERNIIVEGGATTVHDIREEFTTKEDGGVDRITFDPTNIPLFIAKYDAHGSLLTGTTGRSDTIFKSTRSGDTTSYLALRNGEWHVYRRGVDAGGKQRTMEMYDTSSFPQLKVSKADFLGLDTAATERMLVNIANEFMTAGSIQRVTSPFVPVGIREFANPRNIDSVERDASGKIERILSYYRNGVLELDERLSGTTLTTMEYSDEGILQYKTVSEYTPTMKLRSVLRTDRENGEIARDEYTYNKTDDLIYHAQYVGGHLSQAEKYMYKYE